MLFLLGKTPLHYSAQEGNIEICKALVGAGYSINKQNVMINHSYKVRHHLMSQKNTNMKISSNTSVGYSILLNRYHILDFFYKPRKT